MSIITIQIKNMCCIHCVEAVKEALSTVQANIIHVRLGEALIKEPLDIKNIELALQNRGFELVKNKEQYIVEQVKASILLLLQQATSGNEPFSNSFKLTQFLSAETKLPYRYLSSVFVKEKNTTIEKYFILQKIEKAKELIEYSELQFTEIADKLGYATLQYLSRQFKQVVGHTMQEYKHSKIKSRKPINEI